MNGFDPDRTQRLDVTMIDVQAQQRQQQRRAQQAEWSQSTPFNPERTIMGGNLVTEPTQPRVIKYLGGAEFQTNTNSQWESWLATQPHLTFVPYEVPKPNPQAPSWKQVGVLMLQIGARKRHEYKVIAEVYRR